MKRAFFAFAAATLLAAAFPSAGEAHCRGCGVAAGAMGGLAAGAIIGSAIASSPPVVVEAPPVYDAVPPPDYVAPADAVDGPDYIDGASCHMEMEQVWDGFAYRSHRVEICE